MDYLAFEQPIADLQTEIDELESNNDESSAKVERIRELKNQITKTTREIYEGLSPWQIVQVSRHKDRPHTVDYLSLVFSEFVELHGDRKFGDDRAMRVGFARLDDQKVLVVGHQKGRNFKERTENYFGCAHPEGYRKAMSKMRMAAKFHIPIICFIDTPGAYPGIGAEERGQAQVIAENMFEMARLPTPIICVVIGEGGSGGALGIGVGDRVAMLQYSYYSVISPEGCAGILWKSHEHAPKAADCLRFTSKYLKEFGVVDDVIEEPVGGAHRDHHHMAATLRSYFKRNLRDLANKKLDDLLTSRYEKFRHMGRYLEQAQSAATT
ncbi:MAG: acetyl-CoA carboxylase carboxyltransferase subunit alpha [Pirellulaceae bacterium]